MSCAVAAMAFMAARRAAGSAACRAVELCGAFIGAALRQNRRWECTEQATHSAGRMQRAQQQLFCGRRLESSM